MRTVYHVAGEPVELVQRCLRCHAILCDNDGLQMAGGVRPMYFPAYRLIGCAGNGLWVADDVSADDVRAGLCENKGSVC